MVDEPPLRRPWIPTDEAALRAAFDSGLFEERNWCELKREVGTTKGATIELARDVASLAVDGGTLIVGLDESTPEGNPLHPVALDGFSERVEQIAYMRVHPPLMVDCIAVKSADDDAKGYLVVHVPASALAPHQVEGIYYGRGDKTKRRLSDPEVERLFERRKSWSANAFALLDQVMAFRQAADETRMPQLFIAARPVAAWPEMLRPIVGAHEWHGHLEEVRVAICNDVPTNHALRAQFAQSGGWRGNFSYTRRLDKTATGGRIGADPNYLPQHAQAWSVELDIDEAGTVAYSQAAIGAIDLDFNGIKYTAVYVDAVAVALVELLGAVRLLSERVGYVSEWDFAVTMTNLQDSRTRKSFTPGRVMGNSLEPGYDAASYRQSARANCLELARKPGAVFERLIGLYLRGTQDDTDFRPLMDAIIDQPN
jgi:hypothetical protein